MKSAFSGYQKFVVAVLAFLQFTIILDFMILSPLGAILIPKLQITPAQFGFVVSAYAFSAGAAGLLAAGFADRFDRKRLLLFFYTGFLLGTLFCGLSETYEQLLAARMITGIFGGVIGSIVFAITTDLFPMEMRGRVMGIVQTAFAGSQVLGLPLGLYFSNLWGWHAPFIMIVVIGALAGVLILLKMQPIDAHLRLREAGKQSNPFHHLATTVSNPRYLFAFASMALLSTGGFMIMPFSSAFSVHNVGVPIEQIPMVYMFTGACSIFAGPILGRLSDSIGKFKVFCAGTVVSIATILYYTQMGVSPVWQLIVLSIIMFISISARMISASALISGVPAPAHRGSFMSVSSSMQQIAGGISAGISGLIVTESATGGIEHFDRVGYVVTGAMLVMVVMMRALNRMVQTPAAGAQAAPAPVVAAEPVME